MEEVENIIEKKHMIEMILEKKEQVKNLDEKQRVQNCATHNTNGLSFSSQ